jgi:hypothetical protein
MKISKMLDKERKEEIDLDERLKFKYALIDTSKNNEVIALSSDDKELKSRVHYKNRGRSKVVKLKRPVANDKMIGYPLKEETCPICHQDPCVCEKLQESGHQDVPSMKTQVQIAMDALQKMNTELGKLSDEDELPTWWTNKVATAVNKLDGMADYIDAKHDQGQKMNEDNITEERVFVVRFEKEGMRFAVPFSDMKRAKDGEKILKKSAGVSNVSITKDILKPGVSMSKFRTRQEGRILPESKMGAFFLDMQIDANEMSERDFIKKYQGEMGMTARELKDLYREMTEEVDLDEDIKGFKPHVGPRDTLSYHLPKQKKSMKAFFDLVSKHPKVKNVKQETLRGRGGTVSKIDYDTDKNTQAALMRELDKLEKKFGEYAGQTNVVEEVHPMVKAAALATTVWAERRHVDPADIDVKATAADRKAADKNIIIQLRRAQDMEKQTGRADQSGIEFLDKKKQKVDPKIINKALDMFDKMKPNDKAKMQKTIGKSYRDLLKTVQRGRV